MAETVTLQWYLKNLNEMLEKQSPTEVVSHCRYILQRFPKNVQTYRLLGKALLQKGHSEELPTSFNEAEEIFLRVLSVLPGDCDAHRSLSEIREQAKALDQAMWHMERAYEQMPGDPRLQEDLRRLYAKRTGSQSAAKIQLTRGALARQYVQAHLYEQALAELRAALDQSPERIDLEVLLAETLWESQHPVEAGEVAVQILKRLPNCLPALRIMAQLWLNYERPTDAQLYLEQIEALDPYEAVRLVRPGVNVPDTVRLPRLDYSARAAAALSSETPDWVEELGDISDIQDVFQAPAAFAPSNAQPASTGPDRIDTGAIFGMPLGNEEVPDWYGGQAADFPLPDLSQVFPEQPTPDWMNEPPRFEDPGQGLPAPEVPDWFSDIPDMNTTPTQAETPSVEADWLSFEDELFGDSGQPTGAAPQDERPSSGFTDLLHGIERSQAITDEFNAQLDHVEPVAPDWLTSFDETETSEPPLPEPDMMAWFNENLPEQAAPNQPEQSPTPDAFSWDDLENFDAAALTDAAPNADVDSLFSEQDEPSWLSEPQEQASSVTSEELNALRQASMPPEDLSEFFRDEESAPDQQRTSAPDTSDDWLAEFGVFDEAEFGAALAGTEMPSNEAPVDNQSSAEGWLTDAEAFDEAEFSAALDAAETPAAEAPITQPPVAASAEDWQAGFEAFDETEFSSALAMAETPAAETPTEELLAEDWLTEADAFDEAEFSAALQEVGTPSEEAPTSEAAPAGDWLAGFEAFDEAEFSAALDATETPVEESAPAEDWLTEADAFDEAEFSAVLDAAETPTAGTPVEVSASEDWLAEVEAFDDAEFSAALQEAETPAAETPVEESAPAEDWLTEADVFDEAEFSAALQEVEIPAAETPVEVLASGDWLAEIEAFDDAEFSAALAAAEMPADEESQEFELPAEGAAELPDWVKAAAPVEQANEPLQPSDAMPLEEDLLTFFDVEHEEPSMQADLIESAADSSPELGWLKAEPDQDDWLASFAKPETETPQAEIEAQPLAETWLGDDQPADDGILSFEAEEEFLFGSSETEVQAPELPVQAIEAALSDEEAEIEEEPWQPETPVTQDETPAWLSEIEPIDAPPVEETRSTLDEAYDPFGEEHADQAPAYESAKVTGILQPFEEPDWMAAFSDEELPTEQNTEVEEAFSVDFLGLGFEDSASATVDEEPPITDSLADFELENWDAVEEPLDAMVEEPDSLGDDGVMPDWLAAITSEAEKLDDSFFEESAESYGAVEETGVLQPGSTPDWLMDLRPDEESAEPETPSTVESLSFEIQDSGPAGIPEIDDFFLSDVDLPEQAEDFEFDLEMALASEVRDEVAQPGDLAHTNEDWNTDSISEDFSFDNLQPAWLRRPKEHNPESDSTNHGKPPEAPEWLRDIFEDDDQ